jgi:hypothetical protein
MKHSFMIGIQIDVAQNEVSFVDTDDRDDVDRSLIIIPRRGRSPQAQASL